MNTVKQFVGWALMASPIIAIGVLEYHDYSLGFVSFMAVALMIGVVCLGAKLATG